MKPSSTRLQAECWSLSLLASLICGLFGGPLAWADAPAAPTSPQDDVQFNPAFLTRPSGMPPLGLSRFNQAGGALPGNYRADVYVNDAWIGRRDVLMKERDDHKVFACFSRKALEEMGVDFKRLEQKPESAPMQDEPCRDIAQLVPGAFSGFNSGDLHLDVSVPQKYLRAHARGYVDPQYWDAGAPFAGFLNYNANVYRYDTGSNGASTQYYLGANAGLNLGMWRLRYNGTVTQQDGGNGSQRHYQGTSAYAQRDITDWRSVLTVGDNFTPSDLFNSVPYRGVQLNSDDRMQPESMQGYAPVVRGVAETNAKVSIRQNGNLIYENTVPPGEFSIDDLYNTGFAGDLNVTVTEADGRVRTFVVPYASVRQLLRQGQSRYSVTAGQWRDSTLSQHPDFMQATYQRGVNGSLTLYGGGIAAEHYQAGIFGAGLNTAIGALALDVTQSWANRLPNVAGSENMSGQSYRLAYSKLLESTNTNFTVAAYRYSTTGYLQFRDYVNLLNQNSMVYRTRNQFQLNADQPLPAGWGHVYISGSTQDYWNQRGHDVTYQVGYNNRFKGVNFSLSAGRLHDALGNNVNQYTLSVSMPLGRAAHAPLLTASVNSNSDHSGSTQLAVSGTSGELSNLSYNVYASDTRAPSGSSSGGGGASVQYASSVATVSVGGSSVGHSSQVNAGLMGALVFHPGGVTAAQSVGESFAVINAPGAVGAAVNNTNGVRVNQDGYAVVSSLMPYRQNEVSLDPKGMSENVELQETAQQDAPRAGAIVMLKFATEQGKPVIVTLKRADGSAVPVGALVLADNGDVLAMVGQGSRAFLRGMEGKTLRANWGSERDQQCRFHYPPSARLNGAGYSITEAVCDAE
ncbi:fimbria/pilus outer membrane usher protein [Chromobacterium haemolyticum]|uniref:fimbria/pilus outer membrane usher protein n=1 Tax=Chromobacterium haemolyticum TaxID=394935 RepID=UPI0009D9881B|nr:fimbria/pilus outer membrane usher protein [Chromobacterium haemolyticum]